MKKIRVGILFGGRSGEHEVSLLSATSVLEAINKNKYEVLPIGITKDGRWLTAHHAENLLRGKQDPPLLLRAGDPRATPTGAVLATGNATFVPPVPRAELMPFQISGWTDRDTSHADVIFLCLHGTASRGGTFLEGVAS